MAQAGAGPRKRGDPRDRFPADCVYLRHRTDALVQERAAFREGLERGSARTKTDTKTSTDSKGDSVELPTGHGSC